MPTSTTTTYLVKGMHCNHCRAAVERALRNVPGVENVQVSLEDQQAHVTGTATGEALSNAIDEIGYKLIYPPSSQ